MADIVIMECGHGRRCISDGSVPAEFNCTICKTNKKVVGFRSGHADTTKSFKMENGVT